MTKAERKAAIKAQNQAKAGHEPVKDRATQKEIWVGDTEQIDRLYHHGFTMVQRMVL